MTKYNLRTAKSEDAEFLFNVILEAMNPVSITLRTEAFDYDKEFKEYLKKFEPEKVSVIQYEGKDVGRLRIVRPKESIYIGGIQLLPDFQGKGIGKAIMSDLIEESDRMGTPITLEVHHVNEDVISFYQKLGFKGMNYLEKKLEMKYTPIFLL
ncbi:MAG: GNAT family N-acetyltransferase [Patescibacteria group bacterium]